MRWQSTISRFFTIGNGTRQGGVLSPLLFTCYIRDLLSEIESSHLGCNIGGVFINVLAYADDIVLLAPSWKAMQTLLDLLLKHIGTIDIACNVNKTVCMAFNPRDHAKIVSKAFPMFSIGSTQVQFVPVFKYLGHMITNDLSDDTDIQREMRNMFYRTNLLIRRFHCCSVNVKIMLFRAYCLCLYDAALWKRYNKYTISKMISCYNKCIKLFFGFKRRDSMTGILLELGLPSFNTLLNNSYSIFAKSCISSMNGIIMHLYQ